MRNFTEAGLDQYRVVSGRMASTPDIGNHGAFILPGLEKDTCLLAIASEGCRKQAEWEHVSVRVVRDNGEERVPTWDEMNHVKDLFWEDEETVMQLHPPKSQYVNHRGSVLHLWKPWKKSGKIPLPPQKLV